MLSLYHTLYFEATRNCNLSCPSCSTSSNIKKNNPDLSINIIIKKIFEPAWELGTRQLDLSGGEFLLRKDALDILDEANKIGFKLSIVSNGTTLNRKTIEKIKTITGENLLISLGINDFSDKNKETRDYEAEKILSLINLLEEYYITMNLCVTVGKFNADTFGETIESIDKLGIAYNRIPFSPRNKYCKEQMFDKETMKTIIHPVLRKYFRGYVSYTPFFLSQTTYKTATGQDEKNSIVPTNPSVGCWVGSFYGINAEGEVAPCPLLLDHISGGNIQKTSLKNILFESDLFKNIIQRGNLGGKCGKCRYNYTCGGCRVMAYYQSGDVFAEDPTCFIDEISESEILSIEKETGKNFKNYHRMTRFGNLFKTS